ncbi:MAG: T9SS type A sorting domain-containing protein [Bacteroidetes bacterium]|nr:MAG: T9SS type A sorting domain-containing protein [Bacteroidota bacterium]
MKSKLLLCPVLLMLVIVPGFGQTPAPTNLTAVSSASLCAPAIILSWEYPSETESVEFTVYRKSGALDDTSVQFEIVKRTDDTRYCDYHIERGVTYSYYVAAGVGETEVASLTMVEAQVRPIEFGVINGTVVDDSTNLPPEKYMVKFYPYDGTDDDHDDDDEEECDDDDCDHDDDDECDAIVVFSDSNGNFSARLATGDYYLRVSAEGYVKEYYDNVLKKKEATLVRVVADDTLTFTIRIAKKTKPQFYTLSGWVKDESGNPQRATVTAYVVNKHNAWDWHWWEWGERKLHAKTDPAGNYWLRLRGGDTVVVFVKPKDHDYLSEYWDNKRTYEEADRIAVAGNVFEVNVTLDPKPVYPNGITGYVLDADGVTPLDARVVAYNRTHDNRRCNRYYTETDSTGTYSFANLKPGSYIVLAWSKGYKPTYFRYDGEPTRKWKEADWIAVSETTVVGNIDFRLNARRNHHTQTVVYGSVSASAGGMADAALVYAANINGELEGSAMVEMDGSYEIEGLGTGAYLLTATLMGYDDAQSDGISIVTSNESKRANMTISPDGTMGLGEGGFIATQYRLNQNYPNPFNPGTVVSFVIGTSSFVTLKVYNILGNEVATLVNGVVPAGEHEVRFDGSSLPSGIYIAKLSANNAVVSVRKMMLMK